MRLIEERVQCDIIISIKIMNFLSRSSMNYRIYVTITEVK